MQRTNPTSKLLAAAAAAVLALTWISATRSSSSSPPTLSSPSDHPAISGQVTFLYFDDFEGAAKFYGQTLGLQSTLDLDWVKIYQLSPTSSVGLVNATQGTHRPSDSKPVMVSLVVEDVDGWYEFLKGRGVDIPSPPKDSARSGVRSFGFKDPEGYTLEVFAWLDK
jgi:predicted enzyme related to lactoylglutathione lyase